MTTVMTREAREQFLSDLHVGVLSIANGDSGTVAVPVWYDYAPDRGVRVITSEASAKGRALAAAGRYSLTVQDEDLPYKYVSVEGPVTDVRTVEPDGDLLPMSVRYLGDDLGARYAKEWAATSDAYRMYTMHPERWASSDMTALFG